MLAHLSHVDLARLEPIAPPERQMLIKNVLELFFLCLLAELWST